MATGIMDTDARHSALCATGIAKIMRRPGSDTTRRVLCHESAGRTGNSRATQAMRYIGRVTGTTGVMRGTMKPSAVHPRDVRKACVAIADHAARGQAPTHAHVSESVELYQAIRRGRLADYTTSATFRASDLKCDVSAWAAVRIRACVKAPSRLF